MCIQNQRYNYSKKQKGRLSQQETKDIVIKLNQILGDDKSYFVQNKKYQIDKGKMTVTYRNDNSRYSKTIVVLFEIRLRNFEDIKNNKIFLTNEKIIINKVNKL